jgi:hypothetical protein
MLSHGGSVNSCAASGNSSWAEKKSEWCNTWQAKPPAPPHQTALRYNRPHGENRELRSRFLLLGRPGY